MSIFRSAQGPAFGLSLAAVGASLGVHLAIAAALARAPRHRVARVTGEPVEMAVVNNPSPPPPPAPEPEPPPAAPAAPQALPMPRVRRPRAPAPPPSAHTPSPPQEALPQPVTGVTPESVVEGPADTAVAVGNTLGAGAPSTPQRPPPPSYAGGATGGSGQQPFAPVPEGFVKQWPKTLEEVRAPYPEEARRLDVSGTVRLRVGIDEYGKVREVKVLKGAGYGLDEAASKAMWRFKFSPAVGHEGRPVPFRINYDYTFTPGR